MDIFYYSSGGNSKVFAEKLYQELEKRGLEQKLFRIFSSGGPHQQLAGVSEDPEAVELSAEEVSSLVEGSSRNSLLIVPAYGQFSYARQKVINFTPKSVIHLAMEMWLFEKRVYAVALGNRTFGADYNGQIEPLESAGAKIIGSGELTGGEELVQQVADKIEEIENEDF